MARRGEAGRAPGGEPEPVGEGLRDALLASSSTMATVKPSGDAKADLAALNKEFLQYIESEFKSGAASCDWSPMVKDYIAQRDSLVAQAKDCARDLQMSAEFPVKLKLLLENGVDAPSPT